jgi:hypothetical protein
VRELGFCVCSTIGKLIRVSPWTDRFRACIEVTSRDKESLDGTYIGRKAFLNVALELVLRKYLQMGTIFLEAQINVYGGGISKELMLVEN